MDEDALRDSLVSHNVKKLDPYAERKEAILNEAREIQQKFPKTSDPAERKKLEARYAELDKALSEIKLAEEREAEYIEEARLQGRSWRDDDDDDRPEELKKRDAIERGRKHLLDRQRMGAGEAKQTRLKTEIEYLLRNYTPGQDNRIEQLIDQWRRSGDPQYDPSIRIRFRNAKKQYDSKQNPL